ncbi:ankyrin repeat-containing protein BDA1 isoform X1 [Quercus suber]
MEIRLEEDNITELHKASENGCMVTLHRLIQKDPHILEKISLTPFNETPLHISALLGHVDFTRALLALKPQLAMDLDFHKRCPLHLASANGHVEIVHALLRANEDACLVYDQDGRTPLHYAAMRGNIEVVKALIFAKRDLTRVVLDGGETVLHLCVKYNQLETLKLLVEPVKDDGEFLNSKDHDGGNTILHIAVMLKQIEIVKFLLLVSKVKEGANSLNWMGFTALDVLEHSPKDFKRFTLQNILMDAGVERANNQNNLPPPSATMIGHHESGNPTQLSRQRPLKHKSNWIKELRGALMVVATVITTITYQPALSPPNGVWLTQACLNATCDARTWALGFHVNYRNLFLYFLVSNSITFTASLSVIFLLISGFPLKNKFFTVILTLAMCTTLTFLGTTYVLAFILMIPEKYRQELGELTLLPTKALAYLILFVLLIYIILFLIWLLRMIFKFILRCAKALSC